MDVLGLFLLATADFLLAVIVLDTELQDPRPKLARVRRVSAGAIAHADAMASNLPTTSAAVPALLLPPCENGRYAK
jgi:hypothetical protein